MQSWLKKFKHKEEWDSYNYSVCIVASTLPAKFISLKAQELKIRHVFVLSEEHRQSFATCLNSKKIIKIKCIAKNTMVRFSIYLLLLLYIRLTNKRLIFFHECCVPMLDIAIKLIKPKGFYFPHVSLATYKEITEAEYPKRALDRVLSRVGIFGWFRVYKSPNISNAGCEYAMMLKEYPMSIRIYPLAYARHICAMERVDTLRGGCLTKSILFTVGKTFVLDERLMDVVSKFISISKDNGYICFIKDHPNPIYRIGSIISDVEIVNPSIPSEFLGLGFSFVVGLATSALIDFKNKAICILDMFPEISDDDKRNTRLFYKNSGLEQTSIKYVSSEQEFEEILRAACIERG